MSDYYVGEIRIIPGRVSGQYQAPDGWHICDGSLLTIADNQTLYSLLGTTYGGDGRINFGVPDFRARIPIGYGPEAGTTTSYVLGAMGGVETVSLTTANMPAHTHAWNVSTTTANTTDPTNALYGTVPADATKGGLYEDAHASGFTPTAIDSRLVASTPLTGAHSNIMPVMPLIFIIALNGTYPVQS